MKTPKMETPLWNEVVLAAETQARILATVQRAGLNSSQEIQAPDSHAIRAIENLKGDGPCVQDVAMQATAHHASLSSNEEEDKACLLVALLKGPYTKENGVIALLERNGGSPQGPSGALVLKKENQTKLRKT